MNRKNGSRYIRAIAFVLLFSFAFAGCAKADVKVLTRLAFSGSVYFESYDVGNKRSMEVLVGRASEVCIPTGETVASESEELSYLLYCLSDQSVLAEHQSEMELFPASITKLMTAYMALKYGDLNETVTFSHAASHIGIPGAVTCGFEEGDSMSLGDLVTAMLIASGNDASVAVAEHIAGSVDAFVVKMNEEAKRLGAVDTNFKNPSGLHHVEHKTTAYDMYLLFEELIRYNHFLDAIKATQCSVVYTDAAGNAKLKEFQSTNLFFNGTYEPPEGITIVGGKTGTTSKAGCCLVLYFKDDKNRSYIAEVFHSPSYETLYDKMLMLMRTAAQTDQH